MLTWISANLTNIVVVGVVLVLLALIGLACSLTAQYLDRKSVV